MFYNYFIINSLSDILNYQIDAKLLLLIIIILALIRYIPMDLERYKTRQITQYLTEISSIWLWISFMYLFEIIFFYIVNIFTKISYPIKLGIILLVPLLAIIGYYIAHHNHVERYDVVLNEKNKKESKPLTIIHISDIHYGSMVKEKTLQKTVNTINKIASEKEDTTVITIISGDIADGSCPIHPDAFLPFKEVITPVLFTPGNHDYYQGIDNVKKALKNAGIIILDNDNIEYNQENINIIGLSFSFSETNTTYTLPIKDDKNNILIYHVPQYWKEFSNRGIDIELSGHTHGGQFPPATLVTKLLFKYNHGLYTRKIKQDNIIRTAYLSVTEGVGFFATPIRLCTHSEIVVLNVNRKRN